MRDPRSRVRWPVFALRFVAVGLLAAVSARPGHAKEGLPTRVWTISIGIDGDFSPGAPARVASRDARRLSDFFRTFGDASHPTLLMTDQGPWPSASARVAPIVLASSGRFGPGPVRPRETSC